MFVDVWRVLGLGSTKVYRNGVEIGELSDLQTSGRFEFEIGDSYKFVATPGFDFRFDKICFDEGCTIQSGSPASGIISEDLRFVYVYFKYYSLIVNIHMWREAGGGSVRGYRNGQLLDTLTEDVNTKMFTYNVGDTFKFVASGKEGWVFDKYCLDSTCLRKVGNPYEGVITKDQPTYMYVHFDVETTLPTFREFKLFDIMDLDILFVIGLGIVLLKSKDPATKIIAASVLVYIIINRYKVKSLSVNDFSMSSSCSASIEQPSIVNNSIVLPVAEDIAECPVNFMDAISKNNYKLNEFSFIGKLYNNTKAIRFDDEIAIFAVSEITNWTSQEFGFRLSLEDNRLYGYVQNGTGKPGGWTLFENVVLEENHDGLEHKFRTKVIEKNGYNEFYWYVDNVLRGQLYLKIEPLYSELRYWIVATTHRWESGWDAKGSKLVVSNFRYK